MQDPLVYTPICVTFVVLLEAVAVVAAGVVDVAFTNGVVVVDVVPLKALLLVVVVVGVVDVVFVPEIVIIIIAITSNHSFNETNPLSQSTQSSQCTTKQQPHKNKRKKESTS